MANRNPDSKSDTPIDTELITVARFSEDATPEDCLPATLALTTAAVERGADIVRVHDVEENVEAVAAATELREFESG